ncbi:diguanylate cyclase [Clostridium sp.]|uniref:diguanylate cyclase n=1 Tax=Clostridium sp. TaxID=1506 RepID=UPI003463FE35
MRTTQLILFIVIVSLIVIIFIQKMKIKKLNIIVNRRDEVRRTLYEIMDNIPSIDNEDDIYKLILDGVTKCIAKTDRGSILMEDEEGNFNFRAIKGFDEGLKDIKIPRDEVLLYRYNGFSGPAIISNANELNIKYMNKNRYNRLVKYDASLSIRNVLSMPITLDGRVRGIINIDNIYNDKCVTFDESDIDIMYYIKLELELAIKNFLIKEKWKHIASIDPLTGLYNRRSIEGFLEEEIEKVKEKNSFFSIAMIDIDNFKSINDNFGHNVGDEALRIFAKAIKDVSTYEDICGRIAGDEFILIFKNQGVIEGDLKLKRLQEDLSKKCMRFNLAFSYGVSLIDSKEYKKVNRIIDEIDKKMYFSKKRKGITSFRG